MYQKLYLKRYEQDRKGDGMRELLMVRYGEIGLKGKNIRSFEKKFVLNIKKAVTHIPNVVVIDKHGRVNVEYDEAYQDEVIKAVTNVFGVVSVSPAIKVERDIENLKVKCLEIIKALAEETGAKTFKIETKRADKNYPLTTPEINHAVGGFVFKNMQTLSVDVHHPDILLTIELREKAYIFSKRIPGLGGMPYGSAGKGLLLLSGGIDSPVAGYLMAKRGLELEAIHFHSYPFTSERALDKVINLAGKLNTYTINLKIHNINILEIQKAINEKCPSEEMTILTRSFMMKIAERVANQFQCLGLVTGENLGQVASQTIEGITVTNSMIDLPVFRPLIAYDKNDIIDIAKKIDTFETSILPFEDCCTVFLPERVVTKPRVDKIMESMALLDVDRLIEEAIENKETIIVVHGKRFTKTRGQNTAQM